jgi:hypothetical protein
MVESLTMTWRLFEGLAERRGTMLRKCAEAMGGLV